MFNATKTGFSLKGTRLEQANALVEFIDTVLASGFQSTELSDIRAFLTSSAVQKMTEDDFSRLIWVRFYSALPEYLELCEDEDEKEVSVGPDLDQLLDNAKNDLGYVLFVEHGEDWPAADSIPARAKHAVRPWWKSDKVEVFDCATRRVVWTYTF